MAHVCLDCFDLIIGLIHFVIASIIPGRFKHSYELYRCRSNQNQRDVAPFGFRRNMIDGDQLSQIDCYLYEIILLVKLVSMRSSATSGVSRLLVVI